jgi:hypothetical protein
MANIRHLKSGFPDLYDANIRTAWKEGWNGETEYTDFYLVDDITSEYDAYTQVTGFGSWQQKALGENVAYASIQAGYNCKITPATYSLAYTVEEETMEDDPHSILGMGLSTALGEAGQDTIEIIAAAPFNACSNGVTTAFSPWQTSTSSTAVDSSPDGKCFLAIDHPIVTGGSYANRPATPCSLSQAAIAASKLRLQKMQGAHGQSWSLKGESLVVPPDLEQMADEILLSKTRAYTTDQTANIVANGLTRKTWSRITGATSWFVFAKKASKPGMKGFGTVAKWRVKPTFQRDNEFQSGDRRYKGRFRFGVGYYDWRGIDGSVGA